MFSRSVWASEERKPKKNILILALLIIADREEAMTSKNDSNNYSVVFFRGIATAQLKEAETVKQWDGIAGDLQYIGGELYKDEESGSIYYKDSNGTFCVWCAADRLRRHLHRLYQVCGEKLVKFIK